jgi:hypothetical protein
LNVQDAKELSALLRPEKFFIIQQTEEHITPKRARHHGSLLSKLRLSRHGVKGMLQEERQPIDAMLRRQQVRHAENQQHINVDLSGIAHLTRMVDGAFFWVYILQVVNY